jgi:hypothetical protein
MDIYNYLVSTSPSEFIFKEGVTPFSTWHYPVLIAVSYLLSVVVLRVKFLFKRKQIMKYFNGFTNLKFFSIIHNIILILSSLFMFFGIIFAAIENYQKLGYFRGLFCYDDSNEVPPVSGKIGFWVYIFYLTYFFILKKENSMNLLIPTF